MKRYTQGVEGQTSLRNAASSTACGWNFQMLRCAATPLLNLAARARATEGSQSQSERATPPASARHGGQPISVRTGRISCTGWLGGERGEGARECPPTMWVPPTPRATLPARICSPMIARAAATSAARHALPPGWRAAAAHSCAQDTTSVSDTLSSTSTMFLPASVASRYFLTRTDVT
jgi:hypothetical protein